jgi:hypothetical protein
MPARYFCPLPLELAQCASSKATDHSLSLFLLKKVRRLWKSSFCLWEQIPSLFIAPLPIFTCKAAAGAVCTVANCFANCHSTNNEALVNFKGLSQDGGVQNKLKISAPVSLIKCLSIDTTFQPDPSRWTIPLCWIYSILDCKKKDK